MPSILHLKEKINKFARFLDELLTEISNLHYAKIWLRVLLSMTILSVV